MGWRAMATKRSQKAILWGAVAILLSALVSNSAWSDDIDAAKQDMMACLGNVSTPRSGVEKSVEVEIRRDVASCGREYVTGLQRAGLNRMQAIATAVLDSYEVLGCRYANPTDDDFQNTPQGMRVVTCSSAARP